MLKILTTSKTLLLLFAGLAILSSCNKDLPKAVPIDRPADGVSPTLADLLNDPSFSILKSAVTKAGLMPVLASPANRLTLIAPDDNAFISSGLSQAVVNFLPVESIIGLVSYNILPQVVTNATIPNTFPNLQYPSFLNPAPSVSDLLRLTTFPSKTGAITWINNIPVIAAEMTAVNGVLLKVARVVAPPSQDLWTRIDADPQLTYLKAAITRADSGVAPGARLQDALNTGVNPSAIASNLTIFAPSDAAFKTTLTGAIYQGLLPLVIQQLVGAGYTQAQAQAAAPGIVFPKATALASTPGVFSNPALYGALPAQAVKGILAYHILSSQTAPYTPPGIRVFSVNIPTTPTAVKTLLNSAASHPGLMIQSTFGAAGVIAISVKGVGNATASNVLINPLPGGTSDQHCVNGVIHVIDQVLLPR